MLEVENRICEWIGASELNELIRTFINSHHIISIKKYIKMKIININATLPRDMMALTKVIHFIRFIKKLIKKQNNLMVTSMK